MTLAQAPAPKLRGAERGSEASMRVRKRCLRPVVPGNGRAGETGDRGRSMPRTGPDAAVRSEARPGCAGIMPHAGWHFSGRLALEVLSYSARGIDTIVIIGGHMGSTDRILCRVRGCVRHAARASCRRTPGSCSHSSEPGHRRGSRERQHGGGAPAPRSLPRARDAWSWECGRRRFSACRRPGEGHLSSRGAALGRT